MIAVYILAYLLIGAGLGYFSRGEIANPLIKKVNIISMTLLWPVAALGLLCGTILLSFMNILQRILR